MKKLTIDKANELKAKGITQLASVVKSIYNTTYYNVNSIDDIIANDGRWIPAAYNRYGWRGRVGINGRKINWTKTALISQI